MGRMEARTIYMHVPRFRSPENAIECRVSQAGLGVAGASGRNPQEIAQSEKSRPLGACRAEFARQPIPLQTRMQANGQIRPGAVIPEVIRAAHR